MFYLLLAIVGSGIIPVIFRAFDKLGVNLFWAIPVNYVICVLIGNIWGGRSLGPSDLAAQPWIGFAAVQGILLAVNFYLLAYTAQRAGVAVAALASRLSVAIPSLLAFVLYGDSLTLVKIAGLCAALLALYLCTAPDRKSGVSSARLFQLMPLLVFITFGCYFSILKVFANILSGRRVVSRLCHVRIHICVCVEHHHRTFKTRVFAARFPNEAHLCRNCLGLGSTTLPSMRCSKS